MAPRAAPHPTARAPLSRQRVLRAAMRLADEDGIAALTMRRLAGTLGVEAMSLYHHVANKGALQDAIVDLVIAEIAMPDDADRPWDEAVRAFAISAHAALLRHPWACALVLAPTGRAAGTVHPRLRYMEWLLGRLHDAGFPPTLVYHAYHTLDGHILGFTLWQLAHSPTAPLPPGGADLTGLATDFLRDLPHEELPHLAAHVRQHLAGTPGGGEFEFGLDLILDGLRRARAAGPT